MIRPFLRSAVCLAALIASGTALASGNQHPPKEVKWAFQGATGTVDRQAAQRGYQVYKEVCSSCHSLKRVAYRNLTELGFSEGEAKTLAAGASVQDGPNDHGEMFERPGRLSDHFVGPYANDQAARAANGGALPPDLSLIVKAREDGPNYIYSILTGFEPAPADFKLGPNMHYNPYFPGMQIAMPAPLSEGQVTYADGTKATVEQMSHDVVTFLQWAAEPEMEERKSMGIKVFIYLGIFTVLFYLAKKRVWKDVE
ncbi:MAG: cytochrome c1 [Proteobacteria bacterium]|nr:cytochrome c1 [Pseudomonadota bacterium]